MVRLRHPPMRVDTERAYTGVSHRLEPTARSCEDCAWPDRCEKDGLCWKAEKQAIADARAKPKEPRWSGHSDWTKEAVLTAIRAWTTKHGQAPSRHEWARAGSGHPGVGTVIRLYGKWSDAIVAAGVDPRTHRWNSRTIR